MLNNIMLYQLPAAAASSEWIHRETTLGLRRA